MLKVVTAFTLAHSITLSLAALAIVSLPSRLVESCIAASVVLAALNNVRPIVYRGRWLIEKRTDQILGVSAVAPWDSTGYESPDWTGFIGEGPPQTYPDLPGLWSGKWNRSSCSPRRRWGTGADRACCGCDGMA